MNEKISVPDLPIEQNPTPSDFVLGVRASDGKVVLFPYPIQYKIYWVALIQSGTSAPTAIVLQNTIGDISFTYIADGNFRAVSDGLFTLGKTTVDIGQSNDQSDGINYAELLDPEADENSIVIQTKSDFGTGVNGKLFYTFFEIKVKP